MRVVKGFGFGQRIKNAECDQCAVVANLFRPHGSGCQRVATHGPPMDSRNLSCAGGRDDQSHSGLVGVGGQDIVGVALDPTAKRRRSNVFDAVWQLTHSQNRETRCAPSTRESPERPRQETNTAPSATPRSKVRHGAGVQPAHQTRLPFGPTLHVTFPSVPAAGARAPGTVHGVSACSEGPGNIFST